MPVTVEIGGDYACFSRLEMKVERVSGAGDFGSHFLASGYAMGGYAHSGVRAHSFHEHPPE